MPAFLATVYTEPMPTLAVNDLVRFPQTSGTQKSLKYTETVLRAQFNGRTTV